MYETGKINQVAREMKRYKIRVLGLSETRWLQSGQLRLSSGEQLLYSGHIEEGAPHTEGVALMLAPEAHAALIGWEPVNSCIITVKFTTKKKDIRLNIIQCYAPTSVAEEEKKDDFYQQLQAVLDRRGAKDIPYWWEISTPRMEWTTWATRTSWGHMDWDRWMKMVSALQTCAPWTNWW